MLFFQHDVGRFWIYLLRQKFFDWIGDFQARPLQLRILEKGEMHVTFNSDPFVYQREVFSCQARFFLNFSNERTS